MTAVDALKMCCWTDLILTLKNLWFQWIGSQTFPTVRLSASEPRTWGLAATNNSKWWNINSSYTTLPSPPLWVAFPFGRTPYSSGCHTSVTVTLRTAPAEAIRYGKWSWTNWTGVMIPHSTSLCQVCTHHVAARHCE